MANKKTRSQSRPRSRKASSTRKAATTRSPDSADHSARTPDSLGSTDPNAAVNIEQTTFDPPGEPVPANAEDELEPYEPASAEPIDWTPERAGAVVRAGGYLLHTADGVAREPGGEELWRATEADVEAIGAPLARLLNRYEPTRRVAGYSDEGELLLGVVGYARRNLAERGRIVTAKREAEAVIDDGRGYPGYGVHSGDGPPATEPNVE